MQACNIAHEHTRNCKLLTGLWNCNISFLKFLLKSWKFIGKWMRKNSSRTEWKTKHLKFKFIRVLKWYINTILNNNHHRCTAIIVNLNIYYLQWLILNNFGQFIHEYTSVDISKNTKNNEKLHHKISLKNKDKYS